MSTAGGRLQSDRPRRAPRRITLTLLWALGGLLTVWAVAALYFDAGPPWLGLPLAAIYGLAMFAVLSWVKPRRLATVVCAGGVRPRAGVVAFP